jgi:hypothetical protein
MGWGGHVLNMINRIKEAQYRTPAKHTPLYFDDRHLSEAERLALIKSLRRERTAGLIIKSVILIVSVVVVVLVGYYLFYYKYRH